MLKKIKKSKLIENVCQIHFSFLSFFPKNKKLVMFESFNGRQYSDNPRAIYEYMKKHRPDYQMFWSADRRHVNQFQHQEIDYVVRFSLKWMFMMPTAKYWVTNSRFPLWFRKSKRTVYLQTWHGTPLKKLGIDIEDVKMPGASTDVYKTNFVSEAQKWDYLVSPNRYSSEIFKRAFGFQGTMLETGYPRNDVLTHKNNPETIQHLKEAMNLPLDKKVILYAPTWRDDEFYDKGQYKFEVKMDVKAMQEALGESYVILFRMHYLVAENLQLDDFKGFAYDFSAYEDIRDLYLVSDMLITDYSSVFFDFSILERPMLFYVYDIDNYRDNLRGFYFDFESQAPGPLLKTTAELIQTIHQFDQGEIVSHPLDQSFHQQFAYLEDGKATQRVVEEVFR